MKLTGLDVFDAAIQRTNAWLKELMQELNWSDHRKAYLAFQCVLQSVRDHLSVTDAIRCGEPLPLLIRGSYFDRWEPASTPAPLQSKDDFLSTLCTRMERDGLSADAGEAVARAVFRLLYRKADEGEIIDLQPVMPPVVLELWPLGLRAA